MDVMNMEHEKECKREIWLKMVGIFYTNQKMTAKLGNFLSFNKIYKYHFELSMATCPRAEHIIK